MTVKPVLQIGNPTLRETSADLSFDDPMFQEHLDDLRDTLTHLQAEKKIGRALAAPQIDILKRVIYLQMPDNTFYMINPEITEVSSQTQDVWDSCYSFDVAFFVKVPRHKSIKVRFHDSQGEEKEIEYEGDMAELIQHEVDHLHGILAVDHLRDTTCVMMREEWEKRFGTEFRFKTMG